MGVDSARRLSRKRRNLKRNRTVPQHGPVLPYLVREFLEPNQRPHAPMPKRFVAELSDTSVAADLAFNNIANVTVHAPASERRVVEDIARFAKKPIELHELDPALDNKNLIRGKSCSGHVWKLIDEVAQNFPRMKWWITHNGLSILSMDQHEMASRLRVRALTPFEALAGRLFADRSVNGRVSKGDLTEILRTIDREQFSLKGELSPDQWKDISFQNQKNSRHPIRSFEAAFQKFPRIIRKVLYRARDRYRNAIEF